MEAQRANYTLSRMARLLQVRRQGFYEWVRRQESPSAATSRRQRLAAVAGVFHAMSGQTYGARRITADLRASGERVSVKTVAKVMRTAGIKGISPRQYRPATTVEGPDPFPVPDLIGRDFDQGRANMAWFSDITYLRVADKFAYLCVVRDGHTRRVLGRVVADSLHTDLVEAALRQAVTLRGHLPSKVVFHADRGCQFTSAQIAQAARQLGVLRSMGKTGVCWDNAQAESFWSTFKTEYYNRHVFTTIEDATAGTYTWIDGWYNAKRRHSALGMLSPIQYEHHTKTAQAV